jgi:cytochrome c oxidase assembly protein subunit 11
MDRQRRFHLWRLSAVVVGMFAFGFALGPLYTALCEVTGINGKMKLVPAEELAVLTVDESRTVTVEFLTTVNGGRPWKFQASTPRLQVHPGRLYTVEFIAENTEAHDVIAQAVPNVAPWNAARHLRKTECFCFNNQPFAAGEEKRMPMRFMLDPELPADIDTVTLSYTFFDVTQVAGRPGEKNQALN